MSFLGRLLLGDGSLKPELEDALAAEGLVLAEEGLPGSVRYWHFKAPGKRFHRKITAQRFGIGVSEKRLAVYCRSGKGRLIDAPFSHERLHALEVSAEDEAISFRIDLDQAGDPSMSGVITIRAKTPNAARIADAIRARLS